MTRKLPFTRTLYKFLVDEGFTHIRLLGISNDVQFILIPLRESLSEKFEESDFKIESITSTEVTDMLYPMLGLDFFVKLPNELAGKYQAKDR